jgi:hypothetical protein
MQQHDFLMVEDEYEAMKQAAYAVAVFHEPSKRKAWSKVVGHMLWPTMDPDDAGKKLANHLDKNRSEKLEIREYLWLKREAKRAGCHILHAFDCEFTEYQVSNPVQPKDELVDLQTRYINAAREMKEIADRIESKLDAPYSLPSRPRV